MLPCRRNQLKSVSVGQAEHVGLWLDKFLKQQLKKNESVPTGESTPQQLLIEECAEIPEPDSYPLFYQRWQAALISCGAQMKEAEVQGRLAIGLGDESVIETAITLHHTYGMPYVPGSALKGLAASFARQHLGDSAWHQNGDAYKILFGRPEEAGFLTFFDALYVPGSGYAGRAVYPDVITVHHPDYYQQGQTPADWDNPTPVSFLSATGRYLIALTGPLKWVNAGFRILQLALAEVGVGAKTSSGYGRLSIRETETGLRQVSTAGATPSATAAAPVTEPLIWRSGVTVGSVDTSNTKRGKVKDNETGEVYSFHISVIQGNTPGKNKPVEFVLQDGKVVVVRVK